MAKHGSCPRAFASSFNVSKVKGAELTKSQLRMMLLIKLHSLINQWETVFGLILDRMAP